MKPHTLFAVIAVGSLLASCSKPTGEGSGAGIAESADSSEIVLFNGSDLTGWSHVLVDENLNMDDVWHVEDGVIVCKGEPLGYLFTDSSFQDFKLELDWRWGPGAADGGEAPNSGVLLRIAGEPETFMPTCVEAQLKSGDAGDIWAFFGAAVDGDADRIKNVKGHEALGDFKGVAKMKAAEKPPGEWNHYEITVTGGDIEVKVNGELVNRASGLDVLEGPIGLQSEGAEIHFRDLKVTRL